MSKLRSSNGRASASASSQAALAGASAPDLDRRGRQIACRDVGAALECRDRRVPGAGRHVEHALTARTSAMAFWRRYAVWPRAAWQASQRPRRVMSCAVMANPSERRAAPATAFSSAGS